MIVEPLTDVICTSDIGTVADIVPPKAMVAPTELLESKAVPKGCRVPKTILVDAGIIVPAVTVPAGASVIVLELIAPTVAFAGMPGAATLIPTEIPVTVASEIVLVPIETDPLGVVALTLTIMLPPFALAPPTKVPNETEAETGNDGSAGETVTVFPATPVTFTPGPAPCTSIPGTMPTTVAKDIVVALAVTGADVSVLTAVWKYSVDEALLITVACAFGTAKLGEFK